MGDKWVVLVGPTQIKGDLTYYEQFINMGLALLKYRVLYEGSKYEFIGVLTCNGLLFGKLRQMSSERSIVTKNQNFGPNRSTCCSGINSFSWEWRSCKWGNSDIN